jgi:hypothetical protein
MKVFSAGFHRMTSMFSQLKDLHCFIEDHPITIFLAKDFDELCTVGSSEKRDLPSFVTGRTSGTTLVYLQGSFVKRSRKGPVGFSKRDVLGNAHELLHIYFEHNYSAKYEKRREALPLLFTEGLTVVCAEQITKEFAEPFVSAEELFLKNETNVFQNDKRWITENAYYQSAGHFMDYLLRTISEKENIEI